MHSATNAASGRNQLFRFQFESETRQRQASDEDSTFSTARSERESQRSITDKMELELRMFVQQRIKEAVMLIVWQEQVIG